MAILIGTSGWAFKEWRPGFYPSDLPQARWLEHYCKHLTACEINATFYRMQAPATFEKWAAAAPQSFRFAVKAHRVITHSRVFAPDENRRALIGDFFKSVSTLGDLQGPVLFQFPAQRERDDAALDGLLAALPDGIPTAFEFLSPTWDDDAVTEKLVDHGATRCFTDRTGDAPDRLPPGPVAYVRMRHQRYTDDQMERWRTLLEKEASTRDAYVFTKHEGTAPDDSHGGIGLARWLVDRA
jgi:uncharacterized protein YecE (DUF72 family)